MPTPQQVREKAVKLPFQVDQTGGIGFVTSAEDLAVQEIETIILTLRGERLMRPSFGSSLGAQLFAPIPSNEADFVYSDLTDALISQVKYSTIQSVNPVADNNNATISVDVEYVPISFNVVLSVRVPFSTVVSAQ